MEVEQAAPYTVLRKLGQGAMGVVYEAYDARRGNKVALKMLSRISATSLYRFKNEFRALVDIDHPNLVTLYELRSGGESWFYTMELIEGVSFLEHVRAAASASEGTTSVDTQDNLPAPRSAGPALGSGEVTVMGGPDRGSDGDGLARDDLDDSDGYTVLDDPGHGDSVDSMDEATIMEPARSSESRPIAPEPLSRLDESRARDALLQLARGVHALHEAGRLHRDLKPSNVLVEPDGRVVICDFGLVVDLDGESQKRGLGSRALMGTVAYMSPEQASGQELDEASDWYAFGVILYEMLTGRQPFRGDIPQLLLAKKTEEPPSPESLAANLPIDLVDLCMELLSRDPRARPRGRAILARLGERKRRRAPTLPPPLIDAPYLIGRQDELTVLADALRDSRQGDCVTVYVTGPSGIGKSAVVHCFLAALPSEVTVLTSRCYAREALPYKALDSLMDALASYLDQLPDALADAIIPERIDALARLFPVLEGVQALADRLSIAMEIVQDPHELRSRAAAALRHLFTRMSADGPVVLFIDDVQWGDSDSAALMARVLEPPDPPAVVFIASFRREDRTASPFLVTLDETRAHTGRWVRELVLEPLTNAEIVKLVEQVGDDAIGSNSARRIAHESGGNPFVATELARFMLAATRADDLDDDTAATAEWMESGVSEEELGDGAGTLDSDAVDGEFDGASRRISMGSVLTWRILQLPLESRHLLQAIAVAGRPVRQDLVYDVASIAGDATASLVALQAAHLVRASGSAPGDPVEIYHERFCREILALVPAHEIAAMHRRYAERLEATGERDLEALIDHWRGAGDDRRAMYYAAAAARRAHQALAFDRAAELYQLALELDRMSAAMAALPGASLHGPITTVTNTVHDPIDTHAIQLQLGDALAYGGKSIAAGDVYRRAAASARSPQESTDLLRRAGMQWLIGGRVDDGIAILENVLDRLKKPSRPTAGSAVSDPPTRRSMRGTSPLLSMLWRRVRLRLRGLGFTPRQPGEIAPEDIIYIDTCISLSMGLSMVNPIRATDYQTRAMHRALAVGDTYRIARLFIFEASYQGMRGGRARRRAERIYQRAHAMVAELGNAELEAFFVAMRGVGHYLHSDFQTGLTECERAEALYRTRCIGIVWELDTLRAFQIWALFYLGRWAEQGRRLAAFEAESRARGAVYAHSNLSLPRAYWHLACDQPDLAREALDAAAATWSHQGFHVQHFIILVGQLHVDLYTRDAAAAWQRLDRQLPRVRRSLILQVEQPALLFSHIRARCALAAHDQLGPDRRWLGIASKLTGKLARGDMPWPRAMAALLRAGIACARGARGDALAELDRAEKLCDENSAAMSAACCRYRRSQLLGRADEVRAVAEWMRAEGVVDPERIVDILAPGFAVHTPGILGAAGLLPGKSAG